MEAHEYQAMARVEETHPWFVNRRRLIAGLIRCYAAHLTRPRILDAGSGTGVNLSEYSHWGWAVGIELDQVAATINLRRGNRRVLVGDLCRLPFPSASFDLVLSTDVIEHIKPDVTALQEMGRVLKPTGRILLTTPAYSWAYSEHDRLLHHVRRYDRACLERVVRRAGLRMVHSGRYNVLLSVPLVAARWCRDRMQRESNGSDVGRPLPPFASPALDALWRLEAALAQRLDLRIGLTHLAVLAHA